MLKQTFNDNNLRALWQTMDMFVWSLVRLVDDLQVYMVAGPSGLVAINFRPPPPAEGCSSANNPVILEATRQLRAYFAGALSAFDLPLDLRGTPFQLRVWRELENIPYGETRSYSQVAAVIGAPAAVRAVGAANGANPLPIVVPCHRVIGSGGKLVGYGGGLAAQEATADARRRPGA